MGPLLDGNFCRQSLFGLVVALICVSTHPNDCQGAEADAAPSFRISGTGTLSVDARMHASGVLTLKATPTTSSHDAFASLHNHTGDSFVMSGQLAAASAACYYDTIFRDDFDGDGL